MKRICIFGALRYTRTWPSKTASRSSPSQFNSTALPVRELRRARLRARNEQEENGSA